MRQSRRGEKKGRKGEKENRNRPTRAQELDPLFSFSPFPLCPKTEDENEDEDELILHLWDGLWDLSRLANRAG